MIYPKNFEQKIEFDKIRLILKDLCFSTLGKNLIKDINFSNNFVLINRQINQVDEFRQILLLEDDFPSQNYFDLIPELKRLTVDGTFIDTEKLIELILSLTAILDCLIFFKKDEENKYPFLTELAKAIHFDKGIIKSIERIIDDKGKIKDDASPKLKKIREDLIRKQSSIDKLITRKLNIAKKEGWIARENKVTIRSGRLVIPLSAANKRKIKGFIHDESSTGQTVYLEPTEVFETNNEIRELENDEKREIVKILTEFTEQIRPDIDELIVAYEFLGEIDFIRAKAKFAIQINAVKPILNKKTIIDWFDAKHPLLFLSNKIKQKKVVPLSIKLNNLHRILIISGPNAGGKSVCLKTVGLLQFMLQSGLLVPMKEVSEAGIFDKIFIDIGDEQSLENDLSTYSSHLYNMKYFYENLNSRSLFLIDEFGTGTEPHLGGAIAEAILEKLNENQAYGVITTHYSNLKLLADKSKGITNCAMLFDSKKMQPFYKLKIGIPGSSFAFEIAEKIGLQKEILENAEKKTGTSQLDFDRQLQELEIEKTELNKKSVQNKVADDFLAEMIEKYEQLVKEVEISKKELIENAKEEARQILLNSNKIIENTIKEIREAQASKEKTKEIRAKITQQIIKLDSEKPKSKPSKQGPQQVKINITDQKQEETIFKTGDKVRIEGQEKIGAISEMKGKTATIVFGTVQIKSPINKLQKASNLSAKNEKINPAKSAYSGIIHELNEKMANFKSIIDLRGKRAEESLSMVRLYIDEAILLNISEVRILHGKGSGILRKIIREYLSTVKEINQFRDEHLELGGHGITVIKFR